MKSRVRKPRKSKRYFRRNPPLTRSTTWTWSLQDEAHYQNNPQSPGPPAPNCGPFTDGVFKYPSLVGVDTVTYGENIPNWKGAIRTHTSATTALSGTKYYAKVPIGVAVSDGTTWACQHSYTVGPLTGQRLYWRVPSALVGTVADQRAKSKLLASYIDAKNTWRGGNFFAEIAETIHMLRHPLKSLYHSTYDFAGKVKRIGKVFVKRRDYAKHLSDAWLAFAFGVKPLIADVNDAAEALNERLFGYFGKDACIIKGYGRSEVVVADTFANISPFQYLGDQFDSRVLERAHGSMRYKGQITSLPLTLSTDFQQFGLSLDDFLPAVWEAIPWSFFIDYFTNTGEMIDSLRLGRSGVSWLMSSIRNAGTVNVFPPVRRAHTTPTKSDMSCGTAFSLVVKVSRAQLGAIPYPDFYFKTPNFPSMKWLNIAALAKQVSTSKPVVGQKGVGYFLYDKRPKKRKP